MERTYASVPGITGVAFGQALHEIRIPGDCVRSEFDVGVGEILAGAEGDDAGASHGCCFCVTRINNGGCDSSGGKAECCGPPDYSAANDYCI
jgi:hypothetical protein